MKIKFIRDENGRLSSISAVSECPDGHLSTEENKFVTEIFKKALEAETKVNEAIEKEEAIRKRTGIIEIIKASLRETLSRYTQ